MSEKHLTEQPWKTLVVKQGVKDLGLQKALVAYAKSDATNEPEKTLEALKEIAELAAKLKKTNAAKEEVVAHLDEVIKEVKKTTPVIEARIKLAAAATPAAAAKPAAKDEDEDEGEAAAEFKKDLKKQMVSALAQVKLRAPGDPEQEKEPKPQLKFMAYLAAKNSAVIVARKVGAATKKLLPDIAGVATGGKYFQGECIFEKNAHTFVLEQVPGGLAKKLATALNAETGQKYKVRVRNTDGSATLDSDTDVDPESATAGTEAGDPGSLFNERLKALLSGIKAAAGTQTGDEAKLRASEAGVFARKKDFAQANRVLDAVDALLKKVIGTAAPGRDGGFSIVPLQQSRLVWDSLRKSVQAQLQDLEKAIKAGVRTHNEDETAEDEFEEGEVEDAVKTLYTVMDKLDERLIDKLDEALNAQSDEQRRGRHQEAAGIIKEYQAFAADNPTLAAIDENGFTKSTIRSAVAGALAELAAKF